jgi:hypothetical protein
MTKKSTVIAFAAVLFTASAFGFTGVSFAETPKTPSSWKASQKNIKEYLRHAPGVAGTVTSVTGTSIIISAKNNTTYSIDTSGAKIFKNRNTVITPADVKTGDKIMAQGTFDGTKVLATTVFDGKGVIDKKHNGSFPGVMGIVNSVSPTLLTVTTKDNVVYTVKITASTKIDKKTSNITDIAIGDTVMVRGMVVGNEVTAKTIFDAKIPTNQAPKTKA